MPTKEELRDYLLEVCPELRCISHQLQQNGTKTPFNDFWRFIPADGNWIEDQYCPKLGIDFLQGCDNIFQVKNELALEKIHRIYGHYGLKIWVALHLKDWISGYHETDVLSIRVDKDLFVFITR